MANIDPFSFYCGYWETPTVKITHHFTSHYRGADPHLVVALTGDEKVN